MFTNLYFSKWRFIAFLLVLAVIAPISYVSAFSLTEIFSNKTNNQSKAVIKRNELPIEAKEVLDLIAIGGPYKYSRDGITFKNREQILPLKTKNYYREYTVTTPGLNHRGARRIITGENPPEIFYYTTDHYRSFKQIID